MSKENSNFRNQRRKKKIRKFKECRRKILILDVSEEKKKYEEYLRNIEEKILILDVSEEIFFLKDKFFFSNVNF